MKIKHLKVSNFRNLKEIDTDFWNINILTWKNSSWKTNLTQLLTNCLNTNDKVKDFFWENITTFWPWLDRTIIETTIGDIKTIFQTKSWKKVNLYRPFEFTFKNYISKKTSSSNSFILDYKWEELEFEWDFVNISEVIDWKIVLEKKEVKNIYEKIFTEENNSVLKSDWWYEYFDKFKRITERSIISMDNSTSFSACLSEIYSFITKTYDLDKYKDIVERINKKDKLFWKQNFSEAWFINILWDIQFNNKVFKKFNDDLRYFTDGIIRKVEINTDWSRWFRWDIFIDTPHWPNELWYISAWSAVILYFVAIKNWLELDYSEVYYIRPSIMIFDELDWIIHPSLISKFADLLKFISNDIQLFITSHSTVFIDNFEKEEVYLLKDIWSFWEKVKVKSNILSYKDILEELDDNEKKVFKETPNSELYINWDIDSLFPVTFDRWVKK